MVYFPRQERIFIVFCSISSILIEKCTTDQKMHDKYFLTNPYIRKIHIQPQAYTEFGQFNIVVTQLEKCPHNYVPLILGIKTAKNFSEMFYIIFSFKLSQSKNKIILPTFSNIHCVKNQPKPRKCPPNYVPWPSNNRAFIIINVKINNNHALFYYIYMGNRL